MKGRWDTYKALRVKAKIAAAEDAGPCPNCGATADVELFEVSHPGLRGTAFAPGRISCSARCWENDPDGYLAAVGRSRD